MTPSRIIDLFQALLIGENRGIDLTDRTEVERYSTAENTLTSGHKDPRNQEPKKPRTQERKNPRTQEPKNQRTNEPEFLGVEQCRRFNERRVQASGGGPEGAVRVTVVG